MSTIGWPTILTALQDLFQAGSGLADSRVLFSSNGQKLIRPDGSGAWLSLRFESSNPVGRPYTVETEASGTPAAGQEIQQSTRAQTRVVFTATAFPPEDIADATEAFAILNDCLLETYTPLRASALRTAGIAALKFEPVLRIDGVMGSERFQPRATMMFAFHAHAEKLTYTGYIQTINGEVRNVDTDALYFPFTVDLSV